MDDVEHEAKSQGLRRKAVRRAATPRARAARSAIAWLLLLFLPVHGLTVVYLAFWGPAHFHLDDEGHNHGHAHSHNAALVERHHHPATDASVVTVEADPALDAHALEDGTLPAWSGAVFPAIASSALSPLPGGAGNAIAPAPDAPMKTRFPGRLERPPRLAPA